MLVVRVTLLLLLLLMVVSKRLLLTLLRGSLQMPAEILVAGAKGRIWLDWSGHLVVAL